MPKRGKPIFYPFYLKVIPNNMQKTKKGNNNQQNLHDNIVT